MILLSLANIAEETWPTTGEIDTETASLLLSVQALARDIFDSGVSSSPEYFTLQNQWNAFASDFAQWRASAWFWNPGRRDELVAYRARFNALLGAWQALPGGGVQTAATPVAGAELPPSTLDKVADIGRSLAWIVGFGAALWVGTTLYKEVRRVRG
jgi:hypothetical protein